MRLAVSRSASNPLDNPRPCTRSRGAQKLTSAQSLPYKVHKVDIQKDENRAPWFQAINPNGKIPALTDTFDDGQQIRLFESGSIMQYLVATYDKDFKISYPPGTREFYEMNNWLFFMNVRRRR